MFHSTLQSALDTSPEYVFAEDIARKDGKVVKRFRAGSLSSLCTWYNGLDNKHCYEVLLENRPTRLFFDIEYNCESLKDQLNVLLEMCKKVEPAQTFQILTSCSTTKQSYHVISSLWFKNVYHVGAWVRRLQLGLSYSDDPRVPLLLKALDISVYTKNRMFRIQGSSKMGSDRVLVSPECIWLDTLCQRQPQQVEIRECLEMDGSIPTSTRFNAWDMFECQEGQWIAKVHRTPQTNLHMSSSKLLETLMDWLRLEGYTLTRITFRPERLSYIINTRSHQCMIAKRCHRSNHVYFIVFPWKQSIIQRCFDEECENEYAVLDPPSTVWDIFKKESSCIF
tara:strand:- start:572 stop:1582 length:1011 start_codon:yes stop_codon:yes gene_type:complete